MDLRYHRETDKQFIFCCDSKWKFSKNGIKADEGYTWIEKSDQFKTVNDCTEYLEKHIEELIMSKIEFKSMKPMTKSLLGTGSKSDKIEGNDWGIIQSFMVDPGQFKIDDVVVYRDFLAHNFLDRDKQRFPVDMLKNFARTLPSKSKLLAHMHGGPGEGIYYKSIIQKLSIDETLLRIPDHPNLKIKDHLEEIVKRDGSINWLIGWYYILATNGLRKVIDAGIARHSSISFAAESLVDVKDEDGNILWSEYTGDGEAREGSFVWLGSQFGAGTSKDADSQVIEARLLDIENILRELKVDGNGYETMTLDEITKPLPSEHACRLKSPGQYERFARKNCEQKHDGKCIDVIYGIKKGKSEIQSLRYKIKTWTASEARSHCKGRKGTFEAAAGKDAGDVIPAQKSKKQSGGNIMDKVYFEAEGFDKVLIDPEDLEGTITEVNEAVSEKVTKVTEELSKASESLKEKSNRLKDVEKVFGDDFTGESLKTVNNEYGQLKENLVKDVIKFLQLNELLDNDEEKVKEKTDDLSKRPVKELFEKLTEQQAIYDKAHPGKPTLGDDDKDKKKEELQMVPEDHYTMF